MTAQRRLRLPRRALATLVSSLAVVAALALLAHFAEWRAVRRAVEAPRLGYCAYRVDRGLIERSIELGQGFLLAHQKPAGDFDYEYDWVHKTQSRANNQVRQAGALWGLSLIYRDRPSPALEAAVERSLAFFERHSVAKGGRRCTSYPGDRKGKTGTVALVALAHVEFLRGARGRLPRERLLAHEDRVTEYVNHLARAVNREALFYGEHDASCRSHGEHSPYSDGEALLALVKAARYADHRELTPLVLRAAAAGHTHNVERALALDPDSDQTKGYYQWSSMALFELYDGGWPGAEEFGDRVLALADWMIDVHRVLGRTRNTGYAFEGIIHAYEVARRRGDGARMRKYGCVIDTGLERLMSLQLGHPLANRHLRGVNEADVLAMGGIQNSARDPALRIDVAQHQTHAMLLARRYVHSD